MYAASALTDEESESASESSLSTSSSSISQLSGVLLREAEDDSTFWEKLKRPRICLLWFTVFCCVGVLLIAAVYKMVASISKNDKKDDSGNKPPDFETPTPTQSPVFVFDDSQHLKSITLPSDDYRIEFYWNFTAAGKPHALKTVVVDDVSIVYVGSNSVLRPYVYALVDGPPFNGTVDIALRVWQASILFPASVAVTSTDLFVATPIATHRCIDAHKQIAEAAAHFLDDDSSATQLQMDSWRLENCSLWLQTPLVEEFEDPYTTQRYISIFEDVAFFDANSAENKSNPIPNGSLCVANGVNCHRQSCLSIGFLQASIVCIPDLDNPPKDLSDASDTRLIVVGTGIHNSLGFDWNPANGDFWFNDKGVDDYSHEFPDDTFNRVSAQNMGAAFGFPLCHALGGGNAYNRDPGCVRYFLDETLIETEFSCNELEAADYALGPHVSASGIRFYSSLRHAQMFPPEFDNVAFIAESGSVSRENGIGYRIVAVKLDSETQSTVHSRFVFADGWLHTANDTFWGRVVDLQPLADGSLLVSDNASGFIYRITYSDVRKPDSFFKERNATHCEYDYIAEDP